MEEADHGSQNPYTEIEGYALVDASGVEVGEVEETVYDATSDVLEYLSVNVRAVLADAIEVDPEAELVRAHPGGPLRRVRPGSTRSLRGGRQGRRLV